MACCLTWGYALQSVHLGEALSTISKVVGCCTCPAEARPPLGASGQSALGLRAPRSRSPPYHPPAPPGSPAAWWTLVSLMATAWGKSSLKSIILSSTYFRTWQVLPQVCCKAFDLFQMDTEAGVHQEGEWSEIKSHNGRKRGGRVDVTATALTDKASENFWKCVIRLPRQQIQRNTSRDVWHRNWTLIKMSGMWTKVSEKENTQVKESALLLKDLIINDWNLFF